MATCRFMQRMNAKRISLVRHDGSLKEFLNWELHRSVHSSICEQPLHKNVQRFRGGLVFKAHRRCVSLNSRLERNEEDLAFHAAHEHGAPHLVFQIHIRRLIFLCEEHPDDFDIPLHHHQRTLPAAVDMVHLI